MHATVHRVFGVRTFMAAVLTALCAGAAALLGGAGWIFSEYLTDAVNLHTSPLLRIALPSVAAVYLCTEVAGPFSELSVGVGVLWPELLCLLVYLLVGLPPLLGGIAVIAGVETALVARRCRSIICCSRVRQRSGAKSWQPLRRISRRSRSNSAANRR